MRIEIVLFLISLFLITNIQTRNFYPINDNEAIYSPKVSVIRLAYEVGWERESILKMRFDHRVG